MKTIGTHNYYVYILTNFHKTVLYTGVTNDLKVRLYHHINSDLINNSFTKRYNCFYLVFYETYSDINLAISREKQIKGWNRNKKIELISNFNPTWKFLNDEIY